MWGLKRWLRKRTTAIEIQPDEIFLDSSNLPAFDRDRLEGRITRPIGRTAMQVSASALALLFVLYAGEAGMLQIVHGQEYRERAEQNQLAREIIFADRGVVEDRTGRELADNVRAENAAYSVRSYAPYRGIAHVLGYAKPPAKDTSGVYFREESVGVDGVEAAYDGALAGTNGLRLTETDALGAVVSESTILPPVHGEKLELSIDAAVSQGLYDAIAARAQGSRFRGGAGVVMDVESGELLAMVSYPELELQPLADGDGTAIARYLADPREPFLDRPTQGLYAPGSIVKPIVAVGVLTEGIIDPQKKILSTGALTVPNPYYPESPSVFKDWKAHGSVNLREAIAVSSDVYFYEVGGGFEDQRGIGIAGLERYFRLFGFGASTGLAGFSDEAGTIPTPEWKAEVFPEDPVWRLGNTYHTAIGQYGVQVTPLQAARAAAALANGGVLLTPALIARSTPQGADLDLPPENIQIAREGMRLGVTQGIAGAVNLSFVKVAAKTGTAQVGARNEYMNSWMIGFWPYEHPRFAYAIVLERAPAGTLVGASAASSDFLHWLNQNAPEYLR